nr:MAG TPA: hypothetical protein [Caudoviricetes sp.]
MWMCRQNKCKKSYFAILAQYQLVTNQAWHNI